MPAHSRRFKKRTQWVKKKKQLQNQTRKTLIVNLSSYELSPAQHSLLEKGLSFCPTTTTEPLDKRLTDLLLFERRVRLKSHFQHNISEEDPDSEFKTSKGWTPPKGTSQAMDTFLTTNTTQFITMNTKKKYQNLTKQERGAIRELANNNEITIKPANKGGAIVIQDTEKYIAEAHRQLNNRDHYKCTGSNMTQQVCTRVNNYIRECKKSGHIPYNTADHLMTKTPRTAKFYTLPKIHKAGTPGRPIISANECPTEKISKYVDHYINPLAKQVPSYIKDATHFLEICKKIKNLSPNSLLVTADVSALYTSILHEDGLEAIREALSMRPDKSPPTEVLVALTRLILTNNVFEFEGKHYRQTQGAVMGTKMAPSYAILFMGRLEHELLQYPKPPT